MRGGSRREKVEATDRHLLPERTNGTCEACAAPFPMFHFSFLTRIINIHFLTIVKASKHRSTIGISFPVINLLFDVKVQTTD